MRLGIIVNDGRGGDTRFDADGPKAAEAVNLYASMCVDANGQTPTVEQICDLLADEFEIAREVERARRYRYYLLRSFNEWDIPALISLRRVPDSYPDYEAAHEAAVTLGSPDGSVRAELWMGQEKGWVQTVPSATSDPS